MSTETASLLDGPAAVVETLGPSQQLAVASERGVDTSDATAVLVAASMAVAVWELLGKSMPMIILVSRSIVVGVVKHGRHADFGNPTLGALPL